MKKGDRRIGYEDRLKIKEMCKKGMSVQKIAAEVGFHRATIYNELKRGGDGSVEKYDAEKAQKAI